MYEDQDGDGDDADWAGGSDNEFESDDERDANFKPLAEGRWANPAAAFGGRRARWGGKSRQAANVELLRSRQDAAAAALGLGAAQVLYSGRMDSIWAAFFVGVGVGGEVLPSARLMLAGPCARCRVGNRAGSELPAGTEKQWWCPPP